MPRQTVVWATECVEALIVGRGLGDDGTTADQDRKRFEALQAVYSLGELGRRYAVELAEQVGDHRTRVQHWLRFAPERLQADEEAAKERGTDDHRAFLLTLCDAYYELASPIDGEQQAAAEQGGFAAVGAMRADREEQRNRLAWLSALLQTLGRLHEVESTAALDRSADMDVTDAPTDDTAEFRASYVAAFLAAKPKVQWLFALQNSGGPPVPGLKPTTELVAEVAVDVVRRMTLSSMPASA